MITHRACCRSAPPPPPEGEDEVDEESDSICEPPYVLENTEAIEKSEENFDLEVKKLDATVGEKLKKLSLSDVKPLFEMVRKKYINANNRRFI